MQPITHTAYSALQTAMAASYAVPSATEVFAVSTPMETKLNDAIQASSAFLQMINLIPVTDKIGQAVTMGLSGPLSRRTNTATSDRNGAVAQDPTGIQYTCIKTESDILIPYALLDTWARFTDFQQRYMTMVYNRMALDRILVGWNGTSAAAVSDIATNPSLEDINIGWLKLLEVHNPTNYLLEGATADQIKLGTGGDYENLDQMVYDISRMIPDAHLTGNEVAIVGRHLVSNDMGKVLGNHGQTPTEKSHANTLSKSYGGLVAITVPGFPENGLLVTDPKNLSIYYQAGSVRRATKDYPKRDRIEDYNSSNEAYMIENLQAIAGINAANLVFV